MNRRSGDGEKLDREPYHTPPHIGSGGHNPNDELSEAGRDGTVPCHQAQRIVSVELASISLEYWMEDGNGNDWQ